MADSTAAGADHRQSGGESAPEAVLQAVTTGVVGYTCILVWGAILVSVASGVAGGPPGTLVRQALSPVAIGLGAVTLLVGYLSVTDRSPSFVDLRRPTRRDAAYTVGGVVALFVGLVGLQAALSAIGAAPSAHSVQAAAEEDPRLLLVLIPASLLLVGPGEELIYRNLVQKSMYGAVEGRTAVVVASGVFAIPHLTAFLGGSDAGTVASLGVVFLLSLVLGTVYLRTDNLLVPAVVHGSFNAVQFLLLYLELTGVTPW
jgi:membrane protease YdiL (CAAX protease family)